MPSLWDELDTPIEEVKPVVEETAGSLWGSLDTSVSGESIDLGEPAEQVIEDVPRLVQLEDTKTTMTIPEIEQSKIQAQENIDHLLQIAAGVRQSLSLPLSKVVDDVLSKIGIDMGDESSKNLTKVNKYIDDYNAKHPDQLMHLATIGNMAGQVAVPMAKGVKGFAATEAFLNTLDGIGKREDYDDVILDATIGAAFGASSMTLFNRLTRNVGPLSYEAKLLIDKHPELDEVAISETLKGVPKADQAYALSNIVEDDFVDFAAKSVKPNNSDKLLLKQQLAGRTKVVKKTIGDVDKQVIEAKKFYSDMIDEISLNNPNSFKFDSMVPKLDGLIKRYDKTPSKALSIVNNMRADLEAGQGVMDTRTALQFRQDLNYLLNKSKRHEEKALLKSMKSGVDTFLAKNLDEPTLNMVDHAVTNYSRAMNNSDFIDIMSKYTKQKSTDWVGLKKALKKEKLSSPEVDNAIDIVKEFSGKFKNDKQLRSAVKVTGQAEDPGGFLGALSYAVNTVRDASRFWGTRYEELKIQKAILKSIRNAKNPVDVFKQMEVNSVPPKMIKEMQKALLIEYKPLMETTGDVNLETKFATKAGTIGDDMSTVSLHEASTELLQKSLNTEHTDKITKHLDTIGFFGDTFKRYDGVLNEVSKTLKTSDHANNVKRLTVSVEKEALQLVKEIEKSTGIKVPLHEVQKIVKYKFDDMIKDCN